MTVRQEEIETKYDVTPADAVPDLRDLPGVVAVAPPVVHQLDATYYDTPDLALARHRITLRRRTGGSDAGWHLKLPVDDGARTEIREPLGRFRVNPPPELIAGTRVWVRDHDLRPVARLTTARTLHRLLAADDTVLAELADDHVTAIDLLRPDALALTWREWEIELVAGDRRLLRAATRHLSSHGVRTAAHASKLQRALGDAAPVPARPPGRITPSSSAVDLVVGYLADQLGALTATDPKVRRDERDSVHQLRVATRRLRSALAAYRPVLRREATDPVRAELKWLAEVLGHARDAEVMRERLSALVDGQEPELLLGAVGRRLDADLGGRYVLAHLRVVEALDSVRYFRLLDALEDLAEHPPVTAKAGRRISKVLPDIVTHEWRRVGRARAAAGPLGRRSDADLHEVRKTLKRLRYVGESAEAAYGRKASRLRQAATRAQKPLGDHQDSVMARDLLRRLGVQAHLEGDNGFTFGRLHAIEEERATESEREFEQTFARLAGPPIRRWTE